MTTSTKVINYFRFLFSRIVFAILLFRYMPIIDAKEIGPEFDLIKKDLEGDSSILLTELDESEARFYNISYAPWVFILGALATTLLIAIPLALVLLGGSGEKEEAGYSSPSSSYGGEYRYFFTSRKKRSSAIDLQINSKCNIRQIK